MTNPGYIERCEAYGEEHPSERAALCSDCGEWIEKGEYYLDLGDRCYCECCLDDMPGGRLLALAGVSMTEVS